MEKNSKIYVAGHKGLVGSAIWRNLQGKGYTNLVGRSHAELDLMDTAATQAFFDEEKPDYVIVASAKVGGIQANSVYRGQFIYENLMIACNTIHQSYTHGVKFPNSTRSAGIINHTIPSKTNRSWGVVSLRLRSSPGTIKTGTSGRYRSTTPQSSVVVKSASFSAFS